MGTEESLEQAPTLIAAVRDLMAGFGRAWALCGGWAVDAWIGQQTREHADLDLAIDEDDQLALRELLGDGWLLNGHDPFDDDSTTQWDGHRLVVPAHIHARGHGFELDVQLERRDHESWVFRVASPVAMPLAQAVRPSSWGVPTLAPEAILLYKSAADRRAHDDADFQALLPILHADRRRWLREAIAAVQTDHPWLADLA